MHSRIMNNRLVGFYRMHFSYSNNVKSEYIYFEHPSLKQVPRTLTPTNMDGEGHIFKCPESMYVCPCTRFNTLGAPEPAGGNDQPRRRRWTHWAPLVLKPPKPWTLSASRLLAVQQRALAAQPLGRQARWLADGWLAQAVCIIGPHNPVTTT